MGFRFFCSLVLLPIRRTMSCRSSPARPSDNHFVFSFAAFRVLENFAAAYVQVFNYHATLFCRYSTSVNLALFGRVINQFRFRHGSHIVFPVWKDLFRFLYFLFRRRSNVRFRSGHCPAQVRFFVFGLNRCHIQCTSVCRNC